MLPGVDHFRSLCKKYETKRIGLVTNDVAQTSNGIKTRIALLQNGFNLCKIFSPEHGINASGIDGSFQANTKDPATGLEIISLYGDNLYPTKQDLNKIDVVLFDIPDVGCRFYTYLWTMTYVMEACAEHHKPFIILDRPNPIGGNLDLAEGPLLDEENCSAFIGRWSIPIRHSCTYGELATYFSSTKIKGLDLQVIKASGWNRNEMIEEKDFIPTSPAIQDLTTAILYPGMGLLEGVNVNEGRGTGKAFNICGAPWINNKLLLERFLSKKCEGVTAQENSFIAMDGPYKGESCNGLKFNITHRKYFRPVKTGIELLKSIAELYPQFLTERAYPTRANPSGALHLDKLIGVHQSFEKLKSDFIFSFSTEEWKRNIRSSLLY